MDIEDLTSRIIDLVASNPGQMSCDEYAAIAGEIQMRGPCSLLVFGLGKDTQLWVDVNRNGKTAFLEHDPRWLRWPMSIERPPIEVARVEYKTKVRDMELLRQADPADLAMLLPERIRERQWGVIIVDAPPGQSLACPGRFQSIYEASRLAAPDACVFVHDIDRPVEKWFSTRFLGKPIETVHRLGVFGTKAKRPRR